MNYFWLCWEKFDWKKEVFWPNFKWFHWPCFFCHEIPLSAEGRGTALAHQFYSTYIDEIEKGFECGSITYNFRIVRLMNECVFALFPHPQIGSNWSLLSKFYCKFHSIELCEMSSDPSDGPIQKEKNGQIQRPNSDVNGQEMVSAFVPFIWPLSSSQPRTFILCNWNWIVCFAIEMDGVNCSFRWVLSLVWDCHHLRTFVFSIVLNAHCI